MELGGGLLVGDMRPLSFSESSLGLDLESCIDAPPFNRLATMTDAMNHITKLKPFISLKQKLWGRILFMVPMKVWGRIPIIVHGS